MSLPDVIGSKKWNLANRSLKSDFPNLEEFISELKI